MVPGLVDRSHACTIAFFSPSFSLSYSIGQNVPHASSYFGVEKTRRSSPLGCYSSAYNGRVQDITPSSHLPPCMISTSG